MKPRHHAKPEMTVAQSTLQLRNLLTGCSDAALYGFDAEYLSRCYKVKPMVAMQMLRDQREYRRVRDA
jgi:hypothetical protein